MKLYILVSPVLVSSDLKFSGDGDTGPVHQDGLSYRRRVGGIQRSGDTLQIINPEIGGTGKPDSNAVGMISGRANTAVGFATGGASSIMTSRPEALPEVCFQNDNKSNSSGGGGGGSGMPSMSGSSKEQAYKGK